MTDYTRIKVGTEGGVMRLSLFNPQRKNAIGRVMIGEMCHALKAAADDATVRSIVLTGDGDAFCSGGDFTGDSPVAGSPTLGEGDFAELLLAMTNSPLPIVARVNGHAMGGGIGLVAASHFAVAARGAKLGTPEVNVGLFPMMIMAVLQRIVPKRRLLEMMLFGERIEADEAASLGLVNKAVDAAQLDAAVSAITETIASKSRVTLKLGLEAFAAQDDLDLETALPMLRDRLAGCLATDDAREGLTAFLEKRKPNWTGR